MVVVVVAVVMVVVVERVSGPHKTTKIQPTNITRCDDPSLTLPSPFLYPSYTLPHPPCGRFHHFTPAAASTLRHGGSSAVRGEKQMMGMQYYPYLSLTPPPPFSFLLLLSALSPSPLLSPPFLRPLTEGRRGVGLADGVTGLMNEYKTGFVEWLFVRPA
ncbi:hypothetical protein E2C01_049217 [Portunus trituberculatus]|uniref:Uncharacterized protein n=1 Tax=Portunus trituberculatus TaxID=210409 RepID=A0A5B7GD40_PORTR|nr:hypothetical protein [Portunus trituberculatus]